MSDFTVDGGVLTKYNGKGGEVIIPDGVTEIGKGAFTWSSGVTGVTLPLSLKKIEWYSFFECGSDRFSVHASDIAQFYENKFNFTVRYSLYIDGEELRELIIPEGVSELGISFSRCRSIKSIKLPESLSSIDERTFMRCEGLESAVLPSGLKRLGNNAFSQCESLRTVKLPEGLSELGESAFEDCISLSELTFPESVTKLGDSLLRGCKNLESVTFKGELPSLGENIFRGCGSLKRVFVRKGTDTGALKLPAGCQITEND